MKRMKYGQVAALAAAMMLLLGAGGIGCNKSAKKAADEPAAAKEAPAKASPPAKGEKPGLPPGHPEVGGKAEQISAAHILVAFKGAMRADPKVTRTREEAEKMAKEIAAEAKKDPAKFAELAKAKSDAPDKDRGGDLGVIPAGMGKHPFAQATKSLKLGEVADPVETPFGFHVLKRKELPPQHAGSHILVAYKGAQRATPKITRTKEEAKKEATALAVEARKDPTKFADLAKAKSDGPSGAKGGSLGKWVKGMMVPAFDKAIGEMKIGDISEPIETPFGFHIITRQDPAKVQ